jgi:rhamnosyltransferase
LVTESSCAAIVSAYQPTRTLIGNVRALLAQFDLVVVVEDGSGNGEAVLRECAELGALTVIQPENLGIGAALNRGVDAARAARPDLVAVITFDQDSLPAQGLLERYRAAIEGAEAAGQVVGSVSPAVVGGRAVRRRSHSAVYVRAVEPIQSGLLIPLALLDDVGGFDEDLFIDGVDTDIHWRLIGRGYVAIAADGVELQHELGARSRARFFGRPVAVRGRPVMIMQSAPFRYYYLARNRILLLRRYLRRYPGPMIRGLVLDARHVAVVAILGSSRRERLGYAVKGIRNGLSGSTGRLVEPTERPGQGRRKGVGR